MDQDTQITQEAEKIERKCFKADKKLVEWLNERLELELKRRGLQAGEKLPPSWYKAMKSSGARKTEILDDIIFQSMTNLIHFFDVIDKSPELNTLFEKDVIELLDCRFVKEDMNLINGGMNTSALHFRSNNFARLVLTALRIPKGKMKTKGTITDFRLAILYQLQSVIRDFVEDILRRDYGWNGPITRKVADDFLDSLRWLTFIAKPAADAVDIEYHRIIDVPPMKLPD